ncbi:hypothetical protein D6T64_17865 [Cryobacterium melibiosiphilum]|uniref:SipW-cognate class signal peptide n=1 Tax=Cryobacterium melibiosiphilum TaxID=995039 RepID=A0A3A5M9A1_9MICO|nr:hypothetical protein [Cryobacterium melibiosiphilum]RJT86138.1 hypothetical protein D6T64_17865 [Cryobacterium melibiosiphilum]
MRKKMSKKAIAIALVTTVVLGGAGAAFAYWTSTGTGQSTATMGTTTTVTVVQDATVAAAAIAELYPSDTVTIPLTGKFVNTNDGPVNIYSVTAKVDSVSPSTCGVENFEIKGSPMIRAIADQPVPVSTEATPGGSWSGATLGLLETDLNQDLCKNAVATIKYTAEATETVPAG